jgi:hypothetical protein
LIVVFFFSVYGLVITVVVLPVDNVVIAGFSIIIFPLFGVLALVSMVLLPLLKLVFSGF